MEPILILDSNAYGANAPCGCHAKRDAQGTVSFTLCAVHGAGPDLRVACSAAREYLSKTWTVLWRESLKDLINCSLQKTQHRKVCAWHKKNFGFDLVLQAGIEPTSHGMCQECLKIEKAEVGES